MDAPAILPISSDEVEACLALLQGRRPLLAVSGGADSMALMGMAAGWAARHGVDVQVAVVDHGLRRGSAGEADFVLAMAAELGLPGAVLRWEGDKPHSGIQDAARLARYRLLTDHAARIGADAIVTAHTLDDQAETLMMRLAAGSGAAGMAGMQMSAVTCGMTHLRPLLGIAKDRLVATCRSHGWRWIDDPSNRNEAFGRVRWRALMPLLAREGLTAERLGQFARRMAEAEFAMRQMAETALASCAVSRKESAWQVDARALFAHPDAIVVRAVAALLQPQADEAGKPYGARLARLETLVAALRAALAARKVLTRTLAGQLLSLKADGLLVCRPESPRRRGCVNPVRRPSLGNGLPEN